MEQIRDGWQKEVNGILSEAFRRGRSQLYEHEVYRILSSLDIRTPVWEFITSPEEITRELLSRFGSSRVVLKVVSPEVAHKEKLGGVKVLHKDLEFLRYSFEKMRKAFTDQGFPVEGILLVAFVEYSPELGNEILLGFRESETFGPVVSFSKGGSDAEHFAAHFSPPNLLLAPVNREWAQALLTSTEIRKKFIQQKKEDLLDQAIDTMVKLSDLSVYFSQFFESPSEFVLSEFEINPFVFDLDRNFIALDGYALFGKKETAYWDRPVKPFENLSAFFSPRGVAVAGISGSDPAKAGNVIAANLVRLGRKDLYCLNPRGGQVEVEGLTLPLYRNLAELPAVPELVVVTVPAEQTLPVVEEAARAGVKAILLIPGGFSEVSGNQDLEDRIRGITEAAGIRVMGPNCLGVVYAGGEDEPGLNTFFIPRNKFSLDLSRKKDIALFSQSGALGLVELSNLRNAVSPQVVVSYGNQLDVDPCDLVSYFNGREEIKVMGVYIEGFKAGAGRCFFETTRWVKVPVVVYKAGRTEAGRLATQSHTASLAGEYAVAKAAMKQAGLVVADTMEDHLGLIKTFTMLDAKRVRGRRTAVITNAGYEKANAADNLGDLELTSLSPATGKALRAVLPSFVTVESLLDLTPMVSDQLFLSCVDILLAAEEVESLCVSIVPHAGLIHTTDEEIDSFQGNIAQGLVEAAARYDKPLVVSITVTSGADTNYNRLGAVMERGGVPTYLSAEKAMTYLNEFIHHRLIRQDNLLAEWVK